MRSKEHSDPQYSPEEIATAEQAVSEFTDFMRQWRPNIIGDFLWRDAVSQFIGNPQMLELTGFEEYKGVQELSGGLVGKYLRAGKDATTAQDREAAVRNQFGRMFLEHSKRLGIQPISMLEATYEQATNEFVKMKYPPQSE